ncbi:hypothetical protein N7493_006073 [Penicillium malachiteum]|uniref:Uncharacterized protein n=1 Tax=Penicillium malachiteum TaxID=1324776 RepID=A0AAD6MW04_9EURO|nr:hypothetical protein N7493_006073 [Penicillium malachiteum]
MSYEKDKRFTPPFTDHVHAPPPYIQDSPPPPYLSAEEEPSDREVKRKLKYKDLNLDVSYVDKVTIPEVKRAKKQIWPLPDELIVDRRKVPPGWNDQEPDLDPEDYDAQIKRCDERIQEGIMPFIYQWKKEGFESCKVHRDLDTAKRIRVLEMMVEELKQPGKDFFEQLSNAEAILQAYRSRKLKWTQGLVTYWSKGKQISKPRPMDMQEFTLINREHEGYKSFWAEGVS